MSRESADLFFYIRHSKSFGLGYFIRRKMWQSSYFLQDTFLTRFNRLIGCKLRGHKDSRVIPTDDFLGERSFCFACYKQVGGITQRAQGRRESHRQADVTHPESNPVSGDNPDEARRL